MVARRCIEGEERERAPAFGIFVFFLMGRRVVKMAPSSGALDKKVCVATWPRGEDGPPRGDYGTPRGDDGAVLLLVSSVSTDSLVNLHVLQQVRLLAERLGARVALERLLARVRPQVHFDVGLVEESAVADVATMHRFLLAAFRSHHSGDFTLTRTVFVPRLGGCGRRRSGRTRGSGTGARNGIIQVILDDVVLLLLRLVLRCRDCSPSGGRETAGAVVGTAAAAAGE